MVQIYKPQVSVLIRTYNESKWIETVLKSIHGQSYKNYEIIVVDSESTDNTIDICKKYGCKIVNIKKSDFNYSYASNVGIKNCAGEIVNFLSGHSVPVNNDYLERAVRHFANNNVMGVYGEVKALPDGSITEKLFHYMGYKNSQRKGVISEIEVHPGILSCSNAFINKEFAKNNPFKIELGKGGEDVEMAHNIIKNKYSIIKDPNLLVMHSHGSNLLKFLKEMKAWRTMYQQVHNFIGK